MKNIYFLGIGGIGMSAIARYFMHEGYAVAGYDRTATPLTRELEREGALVHYEDDPELIPETMRSAEDTLVVLTPAIPHDHREWAWLKEQGFTIEKRSAMLGVLSEGQYGCCGYSRQDHYIDTRCVAQPRRSPRGKCIPGRHLS